MPVGFLSGLAPLCFIPTGNFSRIVSCPAWIHCVSSRQETFRPEISRLRFAPLEMTERHGAAVFHTNKKLFMKGFLFGIAPSCFITAGNFLRIVSYPAWLHCISYRQETFCKWFPIRHSSIAFHTGRKLFVYSFLSGMVPLRFTSIGHYSQMVPIRHGSIAFHTGRKLFAYGFPSGIAPLRFISIGNFSQMVPIRHGSIAFHLHRKLSPIRV